MGVDVPGEDQRVLGIVGLEGDATEQVDSVERDAFAGEDEEKGEEGGPGVAVVEGMEEADVEIGAGGAGGQREGPSAVRCALGQAGVEVGSGVRADAVAFPAPLAKAGKLRNGGGCAVSRTCCCQPRSSSRSSEAPRAASARINSRAASRPSARAGSTAPSKKTIPPGRRRHRFSAGDERWPVLGKEHDEFTSTVHHMRQPQSATPVQHPCDQFAALDDPVELHVVPHQLIRRPVDPAPHVGTRPERREQLVPQAGRCRVLHPSVKAFLHSRFARGVSRPHLALRTRISPPGREQVPIHGHLPLWDATERGASRQRVLRARRVGLPARREGSRLARGCEGPAMLTSSPS